MNKKYHGKVILFGEYSMIFGSEALLIPYDSVFGEWSSVINRPSDRGFNLNKKLFEFFDYLRKDNKFRILDLRRFEMELNAGLYFDSNIPLGYGVGSSGALVAAVYDRFKLIEIDDTLKLKSFLASMENYFHGSSSGIDPLQCYFGKPFVLSQQTTDNGQQSSFTILDNDFISDDIHIFLLDTNIKSPTGPLVEHFKERRRDEKYLDKFNNEYVPLVSECIDCLVEKKDDEFFANLLRLSTLQLELLSHTIPDNYKEYFLKDINEDHFQIKLCGAGGGGFLLGFSDDIEATDRYWEDRGKKISWIR